ncbi:Uncharacterized oxidoreductase SA2266,Uncharacterized oxidoreductase Lmo0432,Uncharacterized oxidoreductase SAR2567,Uncharacterized oxidoreductase SACOL2488,Uncharacterized oxidoreductase Lin0452,Uncharacterized oxidoreductase SSP0419 [Staphylococcus saprophyticus subsp. saprophyticus ATCC 15305 _ NCTC 7292],Uncharacterized oxidoreductase SH0585 [Mytilus coruscus]|uniref:NADP-dependent 3-hydroxy acid dehydrogenase YdfG n=1 Tax=Mytilus coruscus TaxID=42192 RepID=A0A6J8C3D7_MYTCO|nr:unnamed protein product [Mytilus coruscus]CAC5390929.1 Uncharacterized oxidoreductase SA2266,Uncharacterized oxidoreductase Lmo0432,Uncharacterized oxidoreductase SAR2567,Uncharacterized oxidoreductase SACOL2488,Uncharacterized oxidoreductase Lin0452,Uncharacterized oxidoreductase SSP0419 [Staphylococcus saprophyticus subsp. saprophyticus ATCC 15305 _ NCTC 7292],Uncharacterized oxidoreductase SH0585 [Mytilus coruscus]
MASGNSLAGKVAIVTGASSGIGKATGIALAKAGVKVALAARRIDKLQEVAKQISKNGGVSICVETDVTKRDQIKVLVQETITKLGPVDILVNNAGVWYYSLMQNQMEDLWEEQIDVNIKGLTNCAAAVLDGMIKQGSGHIVNMSSDSGKKGFPGLAVYTGTKFYVEGFSQTLRQEVCKFGIRVTCIQPGDVTVEDREKTHPDPRSKDLDTSYQVGKLLDPTDIANAVLYAVTQPENVAINEVLVQNREFPL